MKQSSAPNELWSVDFKGEFKLGNGQWCYPLTVMDDRSRHLLGVNAQSTTQTDVTQAAFVRLFKEYGLPERIRSDNGVPFASRATAGLSKLSIWWIRLGICPERIPPGKPQQNGKHERMHRTLKADTLKPAKHSMTAQQRCFNGFRGAYNNERPHEALEMTTPTSHYQPSARRYPGKLPAIEYPGYFETRRVSPAGLIYLNNRIVYISGLLHREDVGLEQIDEDQWEVYFSFYRLGRIKLPHKPQGYCSISV